MTMSHIPRVDVVASRYNSAYACSDIKLLIWINSKWICSICSKNGVSVKIQTWRNSQLLSFMKCCVYNIRINFLLKFFFACSEVSMKYLLDRFFSSADNYFWTDEKKKSCRKLSKVVESSTNVKLDDTRKGRQSSGPIL